MVLAIYHLALLVATWLPIFKCNTTSKCVQSCKEPWVKHDDHCYYWSTISANWTAAENHCKKGGGHLASVKCNDTNHFILSELGKRRNTRLWIGGTDRGQQGAWMWTDQSGWDFQYWARNQPREAVKNKICLGPSPKVWVIIKSLLPEKKS